MVSPSIYGIDIDSSAVDIAKLRFWLSLVVDEITPLPLPNLDFKIMQGNSLIETINGFSPIPQNIYLQTKAKNINLFESEYNLFDKNIFDELVDKIHNFYKSDNSEKKSIYKSEIKTLTKKIIFDYIETKERELENSKKNFDSYEKTSKKEKFLKEIESTSNDISKAKKIINEMLNNNFQSEDLFLYKLWFGEVIKSGGFDLIIGNPPYVRQERIKHLKPILEKSYKVYNGTADIYTYFFELGFNLLKQNGILSFITSNKYTRAKYGKELREFILNKTQILEYIDFNGVKVFESATVDTSIFTFSKNIKSDKFLYCDIDSTYKRGDKVKEFCDKKGFLYSQSDLTIESFSFSNPQELAIKKRIEEIGTPLKEWNIKIYRGVLTGFNEAFIIDSKTKDELIEKDSKSAEIIKPLLRGRDIKRYSYEFADKWLINSHNNPPIDVDKYPIIKEHLDKFYPQLEKRLDKGKTPYNLRNCAYLDEFEKEKIIYPDIGKLNFCFDNKDIYLNNTVYFLNTNSKYILSIVNSKTINYWYKLISSSLGDEGSRGFKIFIEQLPIPKISEDKQKPFEILVDEIMQLKEINEDTKGLESKIDKIVYELYGLSEDEIKIVEEK